MRPANDVLSLSIGILFAASSVLMGQAVAVARDHDASERLFARYVSDLLESKCAACHGADPDDFDGGLILTQRDAAIAGGDSGDASVIPGNAEKSPIYLAATRQHDDWSAMPPKEAEALTEIELTRLAEWINGGASWPSEERIQEIVSEFSDQWSAEDGIPMRTSGGLTDKWTNRRYETAGLWAYQPVVDPFKDPARKDLQNQHDRKSVSEKIDLLISNRMPDGLSPAPLADRTTLIRRVSFDLTGLPPTREEIQAFVEDPRADDAAFKIVFERLLASPHYGERMAQHWLDVARYADSSGFANDYERGSAWRYRDYVIRAFNNDKPYDQFVREQIAGDELDPNDPELIVAAGFLRMGPWELTGMEVPKVARQRFLDDVTNSVGETFLAHSLQCARCHDHKFDPVPTRDYYSIQAVFATTQLAERPAGFLPEENKAGFDDQRYLGRMRKHYQSIVDDLDDVLLANAAKWFDEAANEKHFAKWNALVEDLRSKDRSRDVFNEVRNRLMKEGIPQEELPPKLVGFTPEQFGNERVARKGLQRLNWLADRYRPFALGVYSGRARKNLTAVYAPLRMPKKNQQLDKAEKSAILGGGDPFSPTIPVQPGTLSVLDDQIGVEIPTSETGRRKAFADWVADAKNPLTTRTIVNRIWMWHFGDAIAGNPNNFGSTGGKPTHPELLDFLATQLVQNDWSIKSIHRAILMSESYRRSSNHPDPQQLIKLDPLGTSYARFKPRRLDSEELRDASLAVTGELNSMVGGIPNRPEINPEAAMQPRQVMGSFAPAWEPNPLPRQRHRRTIYATKLRGLVDPFADVFNRPSSDFSCEQRSTSTVTPQVFSMFNSDNSANRALALAHQAKVDVIGENSIQSDDVQAIIDRCFQRAYGRSANGEEMKACVDHYQQQTQLLKTIPAAERQYPTSIEREAVEENTGENFRFVERLHSYDDFVPDLQPGQVSLEVRALSDLCLVLMNSNEFVYIY